MSDQPRREHPDPEEREDEHGAALAELQRLVGELGAPAPDGDLHAALEEEHEAQQQQRPLAQQVPAPCRSESPGPASGGGNRMTRKTPIGIRRPGGRRARGWTCNPAAPAGAPGRGALRGPRGRRRRPGRPGRSSRPWPLMSETRALVAPLMIPPPKPNTQTARARNQPEGEKAMPSSPRSTPAAPPMSTPLYPYRSTIGPKTSEATRMPWLISDRSDPRWSDPARAGRSRGAGPSPAW